MPGRIGLLARHSVAPEAPACTESEVTQGDVDLDQEVCCGVIHVDWRLKQTPLLACDAW
jgi:hypothetical protein